MNNNLKPYIICHMLSSVDGKIDCSILEAIESNNDYENTANKLNGSSWLCGRVTMQLHFADKEPFVSVTNKPVNAPSVYVAKKANAYAIVTDTSGKLCWSSDNINGDHLICIVSEKVPEDYLDMLKNKGISYIAAGSKTIDLPQAMNLLGEHFGITRLLLEGGGHINGGFLKAGLIDELSLLVAPAIDGRHGIPAVFDGFSEQNIKAVPLKLIGVEQLQSGILWIRYNINKK